MCDTRERLPDQKQNNTKTSSWNNLCDDVFCVQIIEFQQNIKNIKKYHKISLTISILCAIIQENRKRGAYNELR